MSQVKYTGFVSGWQQHAPIHPVYRWSHLFTSGERL